MKQLKIILSAILILSVVSSCRKDDPNFIDFENLEAGAFLRVTSLNSGIFDLLDLGSSEYSITLQYDNINRESANIQSVDFSVAFNDNTPANGDNSVATTFLSTLAGSSFVVNPDSGKPEATFQISATDVLNTLGLTAAALDGTDVFLMQYTLNLDDGSSWGPTQQGQNVAGGAFFQAPHQTAVSVVCLLTDGYAIGDYQLEQLAGGQDPFFGSGNRFASEVVTLAEGATPTQRTFNVNYITFAGLAFNIDLVCGNVQVPQTPSGLGCGGNPLNWVTDAANVAQFDAGDDSVININFIDDEFNNCGLLLPHTIQLTKQ